MSRFKVGILGATGAVGQKFIRLLDNHPWFTITALGASERSSGKKYKEAVNWIEPSSIPKDVSDISVSDCKPEEMTDVDFVFSGLDSSVATGIELAFAKAGIPVISNAKNYRTHENVPLLVPEVNPDHIEMIDNQTFTENGSGFIVTNPNCVTVPLVMTLRPIYDAFGIESLIMTSMQAISGAGYPGVPSLDITNNVVPYIGGEEDKIASEPLKLLGKLNDGKKVDQADFTIHATATRVPVIEGHLLSVTLKLKKVPSSIKDVKAAIRDWKSPIADLNLPTAPEVALKLYDEPSYPQPRLHAYEGNGLQTSIGRLRKASVFDISFVTMAHNTVRGAAGGAILNAELLVEKGYLKS
ncbi:MAG TPA: aspartate-semialdehyde dehydrogenase [Balneolales bacterium]|nr:aspartate-semialdehyde dehydrogenase [Balneolales bacterium]